MVRKRHPQNRPTKRQFARLISDELRRLGESAPLRLDEAMFSLVRSEPRPKVMYLGTAYREYVNAPPSERNEILRRYGQFWLEADSIVPADYAAARAGLLPRVRSRSFSDLVDLEGRLRGIPGQSDPGYHFAEHLAVRLVYDRPDSAASIHAGHLSRWGMSFEEVLPIALQNLRERTREGLKPHSPGLWRSPWADDHDAARLLLPELITELPVRGEPVAGIPNRNTLMVTGSEDIDGLHRLAQLTKREFEAREAITAIPFRLSAGSWSPFLPPPDHPHYEPFRELWLASQDYDYDHQTYLLRRLRDQSGERVWISKFELAKGQETGQLKSVCFWPLGMQVLVPQTDLVVFFRPNDDLTNGEFFPSVTWDQVRQALGDRLEPTEHHPHRFRVPDGVTEQEAIAMRN